jgi:hypothetical protein
MCYFRLKQRNYHYLLRNDPEERSLEPGELSQYSDQATGWAIRSSNPGTRKKSLSSPKRPPRLWDLLSLICNGYRGPFPGLKWPEH